MIDYAAARTAMVDRQVRPSDVTRLSIITAMLDTPRELFVPAAQRPVAYADALLELGGGRAMLEPRVFAKMLDAADIGPDDLVMDVGCATGYSTAVIARLAAAVVAVEQDEAMAAAAAGHLAELELHNVIVERAALTAGAPDAGPYDAIVLQGAAAEPPKGLLAQLKDGGRLVAVIGAGPMGQARLFTRAGEATSSRALFDAAAPVLPGFDAAHAFVF